MKSTHVCFLSLINTWDQTQYTSSYKCSKHGKRKERKKVKHQKQFKIQTEANKKHIKNLSNKELLDDQINLLAKGLNFIPTPVTDHTQTRRQLLRDLICLQDECAYNTFFTGITINHMLFM